MWEFIEFWRFRCCFGKHAKVVSQGQLLAWWPLQCVLESSLQSGWRIYKKPIVVLYHLNKEIFPVVPILFSPKLFWLKASFPVSMCCFYLNLHFHAPPLNSGSNFRSLKMIIVFFCGEEEGKSSTEDFLVWEIVGHRDPCSKSLLIKVGGSVYTDGRW